ncbi:MAG TPA: class I SAM-dependent methyltransferase [Geobacteraceae bacterium]|nr:class I SAM-dependent methyltransferase [Geobacteraceae bacterium]
MKINAAEFDQIARTVFLPVYPVIADIILKKTGIMSGKCLDVGCGGGYLGIALAAKTALDVCFLDESREMLSIAERNIVDAGVGNRAETLVADVHDIPLPDGSVDLVVSRGSLFFWEKQEKAFAEIHRVLRPGGAAFVGGGMGSARLKARVEAMMKERDCAGLNKAGRLTGKDACGAFAGFLETSAVSCFEMKKDDSGFWIYFRK